MTILPGQIVSQFFWTGTGTGTITAGAAVPDWLLPGSDLNGQTVGYHIRDPDTPGRVEVGQGVWNSGASTLTRAVIWANTLAGTRNPSAAAINYTAANAKIVTIVALPADFGALAALSTVGTTQITDDAVTNAKLANMATGTVKARAAAGTGDPEDKTVGTGLTLDATSLRVNPAGVDHDTLTGFVADEHVPHTGVSVTAQHSVQGGGNIAASPTPFSLVNDTASPGNSKVYGTDASGVRGWKNDPASAADFTSSSSAATALTLSNADLGKHYYLTAATTITLTLDAQAAVPSAGQPGRLAISKAGAGTVTVVMEAGASYQIDGADFSAGPSTASFQITGYAELRILSNASGNNAVWVLDARSNTNHARVVDGAVTFTGGIKVPSGATVSGSLTLASHGGGIYVTSGNCVITPAAGFSVTLKLGGAHTIGAGGTAHTPATGDVVSVICWSPTDVDLVKTVAANVVDLPTS